MHLIVFISYSISRKIRLKIFDTPATNCASRLWTGDKDLFKIIIAQIPC